MVGSRQRLEESAQQLAPHHSAYCVLLSALPMAGCVCTPSFAARLSELNCHDEQLPGVCPSVTEEGYTISNEYLCILLKGIQQYARVSLWLAHLFIRFGIMALVIVFIADGFVRRYTCACVLVPCTFRPCQRRTILRAISRSLSKVEDGGYGHEKAAKRLASLQKMRPCNGEEICGASARFDARQSLRN
jgi:hypothetical protein